MYREHRGFARERKVRSDEDTVLPQIESKSPKEIAKIESEIGDPSARVFEVFQIVRKFVMRKECPETP